MGEIITAFVADLMFQARIESAVKQLGMKVFWMENIDQIISNNEERNSNAEVIEIVLDQLSRLGTILLIFDLGNSAIPWGNWIPVIKSDPRTLQISIICFGSHVDVDTLKQARRTGADTVVARSRFVSALPELIQKYI